MVSKKERRKRRREQEIKAKKNFEVNRQQRETEWNVRKETKSKKIKVYVSASVVIIVVLFALGIYSSSKPGDWDEFAKCLTEKGAIMYGEDWCQYTQGQKNMFGKSFKYINYQIKEDLNLRPTWIINNQRYEKVQSFERLAALTECKL
ncbi:hypothetical protein CMO90_02180 [Candidatus Woesearchaeota archaeon]|jgi:hypothetical protein|nr:hypothetical protein [Candidatus Woesearchaeota archaeon]